ncbi:MAG TPA: hypothetical protein VI916_12300 [Acidimicrobiia bacterium]|nr:hypothetical protein [Acidimicrobiia bacterium]
MTLHRVPDLSDFDAGFFVGVLVGDGCFGGDKRRASVTIRMHINHRNVFDWLMDRLPGGEFYGPYGPYRGDGVHRGAQYVWLARGHFLRETVVPILDRHLKEEHSERAYFRYLGMKRRYGL